MSGNILWLTKPKGYSAKEQFKLDQMLQRTTGIPTNRFFYVSVHTKMSGLLIPKGKNKFIFNMAKMEKAKEVVRNYIKAVKPSLIVINDRATLGIFTNGLISLDACRGSVYTFDGIPCLVVDELRKTIPYKKQEASEEGEAKYVKYGNWLFKKDFEKLKRWYTGSQRKEPKFQYAVARTLEDVQRAKEYLRECILISSDIETKRQFITCISYTGLRANGDIFTYVIPFFNPTKPNNAHWETEEEEVSVWLSVRDINQFDGVKIFQNGSYDNSYFLYNRVPVKNFFLDTQHMFHSIWCELPKKLNFIASVVLDYYKYWKDELKGSEEEKIGNSEAAIERYWRYNGLDTHYTMLSAIILLRLMVSQLQWALQNYVREFELQFGPVFQMSMTGFKVDPERQLAKKLTNLRQYEKALHELQTMTDDKLFNPNSSAQVGELLYDILKVDLPKVRGKVAESIKKKSTDEKLLKLIRANPKNWIARRIIDKIWEAKKPLNNVSKYGTLTYDDKGKPKGLKLHNGRLLSALNASGTETMRLNSKGHHFWVGTNVQNVPVTMRDMCVADTGCVFAEFDYSQSDAWFVAFESEDPKFMETMLSDKDTHCVHAAHFFKRDYDEIYRRYKEKDPWAVHPIRGVRNITKRVVHGSNFQMEATTLFTTMGKEPLLAAAEALGAVYLEVQIEGLQTQSKFRYVYVPKVREIPNNIPVKDRKFIKPVSKLNPSMWPDSVIVEFAGILLEDYHKMYTGLRPWFRRTIEEALENGGRVSNCFGFSRIFFGDIATDPSIHREISAFFGQSSTAENINRSLRTLYYHSPREFLDTSYFVTQTHDSILFLLKEERLHENVKHILTIMEEPVTIKGRIFKVPAEAKVGYSWGDGLIDYHPELTIDELRKAEEKVAMKYAS